MLSLSWRSPSVAPGRKGGSMARDQEAESRVRKLTPRDIRTLPADGGRRRDWRDELERGLTLRVAPDGHRSFTFVYRFAGRVRRFTIGNAEDVALADARKLARQLKGR